MKSSLFILNIKNPAIVFKKVETHTSKLCKVELYHIYTGDFAHTTKIQPM